MNKRITLNKRRSDLGFMCYYFFVNAHFQGDLCYTRKAPPIDPMEQNLMKHVLRKDCDVSSYPFLSKNSHLSELAICPANDIILIGAVGVDKR